MLATTTCATAQNGKFPTSGVSADSVQTEKIRSKQIRKLRSKQTRKLRPKLIKRPRFKP